MSPLEIADRVVPEYRVAPRQGQYPPCHGVIAKRWNAAYLAAEMAIMEERKRCTQILMVRHESHPQDEEQWDGTFYDIAEEIMAEPSQP